MPQPAKKPGATKSAKSSRARRAPATKRPAASPATTASSGRISEDALRAYLKEIRELLVLTGDRLQETMDEAVRRGRMTRDDADRLVQSLVSSGRRQTQDVVADIEALMERSRDETRKRTKQSVKTVTSAARRPPGTDKALQQVDRVRRAAGVGATFPISSYDDLTAAQVTERLADLTPAELRKVRDHERRNANRKSVLGAVERKLG